MSYLEDSIDWQAIQIIDEWLDGNVGESYKRDPLAQDWARVSKVSEELGEAISELILATGQNPRKGVDETAVTRLYMELADTAITAILALQHFTKDTWTTRHIILSKIMAIEDRALKAQKEPITPQ